MLQLDKIRREPVLIPDSHELNWVSIQVGEDDNVPGPSNKLLTSDPATGAHTRLLHLPPGWHDDELDWHPAVEEGLTLQGTCQIGPNLLEEGSYLYRPPGVLHGPVYGDRDVGATFIVHWTARSRILRYKGDTLPHVDGQAITDDYKHLPFEWHQKLDTNTIPWVDAEHGGWAGTRYRWINRHRETGGGAIMIDVPAGWEGSGSEGRGAMEEFVLQGSLTAGKLTFVKWGYACREPGTPAGAYSSEQGARLLCWWDESEL
ncbi:MAG: DUF4437 domain-containing protein [Actinomycetia bacterium]|nr:DUF4437 domain-containing protein [Actinomycetes bacterium]